VIPVSI